MRLLHFYEIEIFLPYKRLNYPYYHHYHPPSVTLHRCWTIAICRPSQPNSLRTTAGPPPSAIEPPPSIVRLPPSSRGIFENVQNISGNSIHLPNALKSTYLAKLFTGIIFSKILKPPAKCPLYVSLRLEYSIFDSHSHSPSPSPVFVKKKLASDKQCQTYMLILKGFKLRFSLS